MPLPRLEIEPTYDEQIGAWFGGSKAISNDEMMRKVFRFNELPDSNIAFIDAVLPGHKRVLMGALGSGAEDENLRSQVENAENYHIDFIKALPGNGAALHSHDTEETFVCLTGQWKIGWGDYGEESITLKQYDGIVVPPGVMRSFENISDSESLLLSILGGKHPGHVVWANSMHRRLQEAQGL